MLTKKIHMQLNPTPDKFSKSLKTRVKNFLTSCQKSFENKISWTNRER